MRIRYWHYIKNCMYGHCSSSAQDGFKEESVVNFIFVIETNIVTYVEQMFGVCYNIIV